MLHNGRARRLAVVFLSVVAVFGGLGAWLLPGLVDKRPACERADQWVAEHGANLPTTFDEVTAFPPVLRQRIFNALPATTKAELWRTHLTNEINGRRLTAEQRALVTEALAMVRPGSYERSRPAASSFAPFAAKVDRSFSRSEINELFLTLGPPDGSWRTLRSARAMLTETLRKRFGVSASGCDCTWGCGGCWNPFAPMAWQCTETQCRPTEGGCGWFGQEPCQNYCRYLDCQ